MKIEQIQQVIEIYNTGSINRAAQNLYLAQSSLSSSVRALEREFGKDIFVRSKLGITLTPFGAEFVGHGREILAHVREINAFAASTETPPLRLNIGVYFLLFAIRLFTDLCNRYQDQNPSFDYIEDTRSSIIESVANGTQELGVLTMPVINRAEWLALMRNRGLEYHRFTTEIPHAIFGKNSPLYELEMDEISVAQLHGKPLILFPERNELFIEIDRKICDIMRPGSLINVADRGSLTAVLKNTGGIYIGTLNANAYKNGGFYDDVKRLPIRDANFFIEIGYIVRQNHIPSFLAQEYLSALQALLSDC